MIRRWLTVLPLAIAVAGTALPATATATASASASASADSPPVPACTSSTQEVTNLVNAVTNVGDALTAEPVRPMQVSQVTGDLVAAVTAAQTAGCLPSLPVSPPAVTPPPPSPLPAVPKCLTSTIDLLTTTLKVLRAAVAVPPNVPRILIIARTLVVALTAINIDQCLPVTLPIPDLPNPPGLPPRSS